MKAAIKFIFTAIIMTVSMPALASNFKCVMESNNPDMLRYEVQVSFAPVGFRVDTFFKENDGTWTSDSETLANSSGVQKPMKILWDALQTQLSSDADKITFAWSKGAQVAGHLTLDLKSRAGEFYSSFEMSDSTVYKRMQFSHCVEIALK